MIHLVYPYTHPQTGKHTAAPWSIGWNLSKELRKRGYQVRNYDWDEPRCVYPDGPDDILLGHPHPEPGRMFRSSVCAPWKRVVSIAPWNGSDEYRRQQEYVWGHVDHHLAICGEYWWKDGREPETPCSSTRLDMAIDPADYPPLKFAADLNPPGHRKFLYIGCTVPHKGTEFLEEIIRQTGIECGHIGYGHVKGAIEHGYIDLCSDEGRELVRRYDHVIIPGKNDANPTTFLEALCWGLPPIWSRQSGWSEELQELGGCVLEYGDVEAFKKCLENPPQPKGVARHVVRKEFSWSRFADRVAAVL